MPNKHAKLAPSASSRWIKCPASQKLIESMNAEDISNAAAIEGTNAHTYAEWCLTNKTPPCDAHLDDYDVFVDEDMVEHIGYYYAYVTETVPIEHLQIEKKVKLFYSTEGETGTCDVIGYDPETKTLHIIDLKYGQGVRVEVEGNTQLLIYAISALDELDFIWDIDNIECHIVQPRMNNTCSQVYTLEEALEYKKTIHAAAKACESENATFNPGESQCLWCPAKGICKALYNRNTEMMHLIFPDEDDEEGEVAFPDKITDAEMKMLIDNSAQITKWLSSLRAEVVNRIQSGKAFPGYKLVRGKSNRKWWDEAKAVDLMTDEMVLLEEEVFQKPKMISPAMFDKLAKKKKLGQEFIDKIESYMVKPEGNSTLVEESDKRPSLTNTGLNVLDDLGEED